MKHPNRLTDMAIYHTLPSTNSALKAMALEGAPEGTVVISDEQSAGRGRMGRSFYSPSGCGIYFSYLFRPNNRSTLPQNITMLASICIARGIQKATGYTPGIKWVNDLYLRGKKICGILTEASMNVEAGCVDYLVMGAGINIYEPHGGYPEDIKDKAGAIMPSGIQWDNTLRLRLMAAILDELSELSASSSFPDYIDEYRRLSIVIGRHVVLTAGNNQKEGVVQGFDDQGHLLLKLRPKPWARPELPRKLTAMHVQAEEGIESLLSYPLIQPVAYRAQPVTSVAKRSESMAERSHPCI